MCIRDRPSTVLLQKASTIDSAVNKKYIGQVESIDRVTVQPRVSGNIVATRFREGNVVRQGDLLFEIEDTRYKAPVELSLIHISYRIPVVVGRIADPYDVVMDCMGALSHVPGRCKCVELN